MSSISQPQLFVFFFYFRGGGIDRDSPMSLFFFFFVFFVGMVSVEPVLTSMIAKKIASFFVGIIMTKIALILTEWFYTGKSRYLSSVSSRSCFHILFFFSHSSFFFLV